MNFSKFPIHIIAGVILFSLSAQAQDSSKVSDLKWNSDFRYRYDGYDYEGENPESKSEQKIRARVGVTGKVVGDNKFEFRLASGPGRTSTNQSLGATNNSMSNYSIGIDRASIGLGVATDTYLTLGRMANPFLLAGGTDLAWDADLNFDGISLRYASSGDYNFVASLSRFVAATKTAAENAVFINTAQVAYKAKVSEDQSYAVTLAMYHYEDIKGHSGLARNAANTAQTMSNNPDDGAGNYSDDYQVGDIGLEYAFKVGGKSLTVFGNYLQNTEATEDNTGYLAGFRYNRLRAKGDWTFGYDFRRLEQRSTIGAYTDGESYGGGVNGESHRINVGYQAGDAWTASLTGMIGGEGIADTDTKQDRNRIIADIVLAF